MAEVWLKDVAAAAGVSVSAASHAVNGTGNLAAKTRERILEVANHLGYQRNPLLSRLAARRFRSGGGPKHVSVGFVSFVGDNPRLEFTAELPIDRMREIGDRYGFSIEAHRVLRSERDAEKYFDTIYRRGVEAVLVGGAEQMDIFNAIDLSRFCVLGVGDIAGEFPYHKVERDWSDSVRVCFTKLWEAGCRRIGAQFFGKTRPTYQDRLRLGAYLSESSTHEHAIGIPPLLLDEGGASAREQLYQWILRENPDGIIVWSLDPVYGLLDRGMRIPEELQVALIYKTLEDHWFEPFAGVTRDRDVGVRQILRILFDQLTHGERGCPEFPITHRIRYPWIDGPSVRNNAG